MNAIRKTRTLVYEINKNEEGEQYYVPDRDQAMQEHKDGDDTFARSMSKSIFKLMDLIEANSFETDIELFEYCLDEQILNPQMLIDLFFKAFKNMLVQTKELEKEPTFKLMSMMRKAKMDVVKDCKSCNPSEDFYCDEHSQFRDSLV